MPALRARPDVKPMMEDAEKMIITDEILINDLNYNCKLYDGLIKMITATKNRLHVLLPESQAKHHQAIKDLEKLHKNISRKIKKQLNCWLIWEEWMENISGIGPYIAGSLILLYYYRFVPICSCGGILKKKSIAGDDKDRKAYVCIECGKKAKGEGVLRTKIEIKDFSNISKWWKYMGVHVDGKTGKKPEKQKGVVCDWSSKGRAINFQIGDQFIRKDSKHLYRKFYDKERKKLDRKHPELTKNHKFNRARNHTGKLFLSHFWQVARTLDDLSVTKPYAETIMGHTGILEPFYWEAK